MTVLIKNVQYFEWEVPVEYQHLLHDEPQEAIDVYFDPNASSTTSPSEQVSDDFYEYVEILSV